jgi:uncharacterized membrane protein YjjP (DUF1212 family)
MVPQMTRLETEVETPTAQELSYKDRQGLAMAWAFSALGLYLLFGGLALGAAVIFNVGFVGWLIGMGLTGLMIVAVIVVVNIFVSGPAR